MNFIVGSNGVVEAVELSAKSQSDSKEEIRVLPIKLDPAEAVS